MARKLLGVVRAAAPAARAPLPVRVARGLYARWRVMSSPQRERIAPLAEDAKQRALDLRGAGDREAAERGLATANETLAAAIVESAEADPEVDGIELRRLREDLRRELERLAGAEIRASRGPGSRDPAGGDSSG